MKTTTVTEILEELASMGKMMENFELEAIFKKYGTHGLSLMVAELASLLDQKA